MILSAYIANYLTIYQLGFFFGQMRFLHKGQGIRSRMLLLFDLPEVYLLFGSSLSHHFFLADAPISSATNSGAKGKTGSEYT